MIDSRFSFHSIYCFLGVVNFNSLNGCLKCCTVGVHSSLLRTNNFPETIAKKRTNELFRAGAYGSHYQSYKIRENGKLKKVPVVTPLLKLPIDMVDDVIVSDSLHLLHLGITKRLLMSYKNGHNGREERRWSDLNVKLISNMLLEIKLPVEFHRQMRSLEYFTSLESIRVRFFPKLHWHCYFEAFY